jgi:hypothetical protein
MEDVKGWACLCNEDKTHTWKKLKMWGKIVMEKKGGEASQISVM